LGAAGDGLAADSGEQGAAQVSDLTAGGGGVGGVKLGGESAGVEVVERVGLAQQSLVRGLGGVVGLGELGADAGLGEQFLLRGEQVDQRGQGGPDLIQDRDLAGGVVAPVADGAAGDVPVLLLDVAAVVAVGRGGRSMPGGVANRSAVRAWSRCQPVSATSSSKIADRSRRVPRSYRPFVAFVTALRALQLQPHS
jgi:hypothetical protein